MKDFEHMDVISSEILEELDALQIGKAQGAPVRFGVKGYDSAVLHAAETKFDFKFPPDYFDLLTKMHDPQKIFANWEDAHEIEYSLTSLRENLEFDIENNYWLKDWGERPNTLSDRLSMFRTIYGTWPKMIPVYGHRFIPCSPHESGNPVFSIVQFDIIIYGNDLVDYIRKEFGGLKDTHPEEYYIQFRGTDRHPPAEYKQIPVWCDLLGGEIYSNKYEGT